MILKHLSIINYRNIPTCELDLSPKINCFLGMNGEGKTNLLDSIHFLSLCRSYATSQDSLCILHDQDIMSIAGLYENEDGTAEDIHIGIRRGQKKVVRRGKKAYKRLVEHIGLIPLVMVSPADQFLIAGGSEERRRFMDIIISQYNPVYMEALLRYNKALQQRNALLKEEIAPDPEMFLLWEEQMAKEAEYIYQCRSEYIKDFTPIFQQFYNHISKEKETVELRYTSHCQRGPLLEQLTNDRFRDQAVGYSLHGVHKDDLEMLLGGYAIKREGSQGQNKTFLIALKLAQFDFLKRTGSKTTPLLLLDDIFEELDAERVEQIVSLVNNDMFGQIFITDTNRDHLDSILQKSNGDYSIFHVKNGNVTV